jgi:signal transduction histidine kinase
LGIFAGRVELHRVHELAGEIEVTDSLTLIQLVHDLKSPLTALQIVESTAVDLTPEHKAVLHSTRQFLESLIRKALGQEDQTMSREEVFRVLNKVARDKMFVHEGLEIEMHQYATDHSPRVRGNVFDLARVVGNLITNSFEAGRRRGQAHPKVIVQLDFSGHRPLIRCSDFSGGLSATDHAQRKNLQLAGNWGVGMSIIRDLCAANSWRICIESHAQGVEVEIHV